MEEDRPVAKKTMAGKVASFFIDIVDKPLVWFRETIVLPNRQEYYWYHEKIRRVPTIDECYKHDVLCRFEANEQFERDRKVDQFILYILKKRSERCVADSFEDLEDCQKLHDKWQNAQTNYFIKYGDIGKKGALACYMKQKNRMAWERRHGPVGSGRKPPPEDDYMPKKSTC